MTTIESLKAELAELEPKEKEAEALLLAAEAVMKQHRREWHAIYCRASAIRTTLATLEPNEKRA